MGAGRYRGREVLVSQEAWEAKTPVRTYSSISSISNMHNALLLSLQPAKNITWSPSSRPPLGHCYACLCFFSQAIKCHILSTSLSQTVVCL